MPTDPPTSLAPLDYALTPSRWRKLIRQILLGSIVVTTSFCAWRFGPTVLHQSQLLYWQRQCMKFSLPPDMVVCEENPTAAARLLKDSRYTPFTVRSVSDGLDPHLPTVKAAALAPQCWQSFRNAPYTNNYRLIDSGGPVAVAFLGQRISPAGHRRLVCVEFAPGRDFLPSFGRSNYAVAVTPATWTTPPSSPVRQGYFDGAVTFESPLPSMRIYAGQPDPKDASHFTIRYQMMSRQDFIDGWLKDDDSVNLHLRALDHHPAK